MSKAADIINSSKEMLEKIAKAKSALALQKAALEEKSARIIAAEEEARKEQARIEQEEARKEYEALRAKEEAEEIAREKAEEEAKAEQKKEAEAKAEAKAEEKPAQTAQKAEQKKEAKPQGKPADSGFKRPNQEGYQNAKADFRKDGKSFNKEKGGFKDKNENYRDNKDGYRDNKDRDNAPRRSQSRAGVVPVIPSEEKARVSNYDPNKKSYRKNHDNEQQQPKNSKKENARRNQSFAGDDEDYFRVRKPKKEKKEPKKEIAPIVIESAVMTTENIGIKDLSEKLGKPAADIVKKLFLMGIMATVNQEIDYETAFMVASEYGIELEQKLTKTFEDTLFDTTDDGDTNGEGYITRPPVVTIMGHVDHGKTSLLDAIRHANVTAGEAGGITQHIGAYQVEADGKKITFIDTPGHEAFTSMRARGAQSTDIAILVVAADDGVMPQTIEAINHAKAAEVPIIVAINKMDKPTADPDRVKTELTQHGIVPEDWGGDTIIVPVSAYTKEGIDKLLEMILLVAEVEDYKANPDLMAKGIIIEARLDKGRGPVASVLVQNGTLKVGDTIVAGTVFGRVRAMMNDKGEKLTVAPPATPVEVLGFNEVPEAGDQLFATEDDRLSRQVAEERKDKIKVAAAKAKAKASLDDLFAQIQEGEMKQLNLIIKADVQGSVEAVKQALEKLSNEEVKVSAIHGAVGAITSSDVTLAQASNAIIIGFNVRPDASARTMAEQEKIDIRLYRIIYDAIEDVEKAMKGMLAPEYKEVILGHAEVRQTFKVPGHGTVAGSYVTDGKITRSSKLRLLRDNIVIHEGEVESLRRFKDDVKEVATGYECGIGIQGYNDIKERDVIEAFIMEEIAR
ncbi:MAG: translation initiation factor IF-2 [Clostridia bacterium]|nr:translation initiation factor IF-2 [Clostridia bacterium]